MELEFLPFTGATQELFAQLFIALGLGFLIGLEREYAKRIVEKEEQFAGVRTYTVISLFGFLSAYLAQHHGQWILVTGLAGLIAMVVASYVMTAKHGSYGITTELSAILAFVIGSLVFRGEVLFAVIITVIITALLSLKVRLHSFVAMLTPQDIRAFIQFVIISAVVLPFLPDEQFGPGGVWNLHEIWTMVILVTGISLVGYILAKVLGSRKGTVLAGVVGGLVSSTAVTLSFSRLAHAHSAAMRILTAVAIIAATATLYPRILLETWVVNKELALVLAPPIALITLVAFGVAYLIHRNGTGADDVQLPLTNPLNFRVAIQFALVYMAVQWLMALVNAQENAWGLYGASLIFGATDMDAITLSIARKAATTNVQGVTAILLATLSNTVMKYLIVIFFGDRTLRKWVGIGFGAIVLVTMIGIMAVRYMQ